MGKMRKGDIMRKSMILAILAAMCQLGAAQRLNESFTGTTFPPMGWVRYNNDHGTAVWLRYANHFLTGPGCAGCPDEADNRNDDWLITRPVFPGGTDTLLTFWTRGLSTGHAENLEIWVSTTNNQLPSFTHLIDTMLVRRNQYTHDTVSLGAFKGQEIYIGFRFAPSKKPLAMYLDDINGPNYPAIDVGVSSIISPWKYEDTGSVVIPVATVTNWGTLTQSGFPSI